MIFDEEAEPSLGMARGNFTKSAGEQPLHCLGVRGPLGLEELEEVIGGLPGGRPDGQVDGVRERVVGRLRIFPAEFETQAVILAEVRVAVFSVAEEMS